MHQPELQQEELWVQEFEDSDPHLQGSAWDRPPEEVFGLEDPGPPEVMDQKDPPPPEWAGSHRAEWGGALHRRHGTC